MKFTYFWINFFTIIIPLIYSFHPKVNFYKYFKSFFPANILAAILFISWDVLFTKMSVWGFNPDYISGIYFFNLPIEEILFFICIPFSCVFTYHTVNLFFNIHWKQKTEHIFVIILSLILFAVGVYFHSKIYTSTTFITLAILLLAVKYLAKVKWLPKAVIVYIVLLFPFFIVNGLLTGTGLEQPVVWYDNTENLDFRLITIPVEDMFYGFALILLNILLFEYFKNFFLMPGIED